LLTLRRNFLTSVGSERTKLVIAYATNDLTAKGINSDHYKYCMTLSPADRNKAHCGDYEQTQGILIFDEGVDENSFFINILDDLCFEKYSKYLQVCTCLHNYFLNLCNFFSFRFLCLYLDLMQFKEKNFKRLCELMMMMLL
jgi:hypothetical protein